MEITKFKFRTNINCGSCVAKVKPHLDLAVGSGNWVVDINDRNKILSIGPCDLNEQQIMGVIEDTGYKIEPIKE